MCPPLIQGAHAGAPLMPRVVIATRYQYFPFTSESWGSEKARGRGCGCRVFCCRIIVFFVWGKKGKNSNPRLAGGDARPTAGDARPTGFSLVPDP